MWGFSFKTIDSVDATTSSVVFELVENEGTENDLDPKEFVENVFELNLW